LRVSVLGCGRWGTFLAWYAARIGHEVLLWGREDSVNFQQLEDTRRNEYLILPHSVNLSSSLEKAMENEYIIVSISAQNLREFAKKLRGPMSKKFILCMKGIESTSGKRLSQVFHEEVGANSRVSIWVGPGHVQDFVAGIPNCMVIGSEDIETTKDIADTFSSDLIRFYYGQDMIGNEIGAASKNVMGIAAGMLDGLNFSSLKGALMARGAREISRLVRIMGGNELTVYGLSHLGDYEATLFSPHSHNRKFGQAFVQGERFQKLAEGVDTVKALRLLSQRHGLELPICNAVHSILFEARSAKEVLLDLFLRPLKFEF
jgi:glycerol-3-phosphate dehydrogenase (NAD(P)+)